MIIRSRKGASYIYIYIYIYECVCVGIRGPGVDIGPWALAKDVKSSEDR